jgi:hypothetical protein
VNKGHDERITQSHLKALNIKGIVDAIAAARGYDGSDIYMDLEKQALEVEGAISRLVKEVEELNASLLINKTLAVQAHNLDAK